MEYQTPYAFRELYEPSRYKVYKGGRASAKSHSVASALLVKGREQRMRFLCLRETQKSLSASVLQLLDDKITDGGMKDFYKVMRDRIEGVNGTIFRFAGLRTNPAAIRSMEGVNIAWVEEADTVSQASLDFLVHTIRNPGSEIWFTFNPRYLSDPVYKMFFGGVAPPGSIIRHVNYDDNPFLSDTIAQEIEWLKVRNYEKYRHIYGGELLSHSQAQVFRHWQTADMDEGQIADETPRLGADWGYSIDPTCVIECYLLPPRTLYFRRERYKVGCEIDEIPSLFAGSDWQTPARWENRHGHTGIESVRRGHNIVADSARPDTISYVKRRGLKISKARKGARSIEEGIEFIRSHDIIVHPSCKHLIDELSHYSYKIDSLTEDVLPELEDKNNHVIDSARYALENARRAMGLGVSVTPPRAVRFTPR